MLFILRWLTNVVTTTLKLYLLHALRFWVPVREHVFNFYRSTDIKRLETIELDDTFVIINKNFVKEFLDYLNSIEKLI